MGVVRFYGLTRSPLERTAASLLAKAHAAGMRVEIRGRDPARLDWLDAALWLGDEAAFLPHGRAGGPHDARQPILLTEAEAVSPGTTCIMAIDGAPVTAAEAAGLDRTLILFDGVDGAATDHARGQWAALRADGATAEFWSDESGGWQRKA